MVGRSGIKTAAFRFFVESTRTFPEVIGMTAGSEAVGLSHGRRLGEAVRQHSRVVGVTSKRDRSSAFFVPPANDLRVERHLGADLQCPTAVSKRSQCVTELILERVRIVRPRDRK